MIMLIDGEIGVVKGLIGEFIPLFPQIEFSVIDASETDINPGFVNRVLDSKNVILVNLFDNNLENVGDDLDLLVSNASCFFIAPKKDVITYMARNRMWKKTRYLFNFSVQTTVMRIVDSVMERLKKDRPFTYLTFDCFL